LRRAIGASIVTVLAVALFMPGAAAIPKAIPSSGCSASGDVCERIQRVNGAWELEIVLAARYFDTYRLCVQAPDATRSCRVFKIGRRGSSYGSLIRWRAHFPDRGPGLYVVRWRALPGNQIVGRILGFKVG
jgi:hypothetical protein